jgi:hypothetical protein
MHGAIIDMPDYRTQDDGRIAQTGAHQLVHL